MKKLISTFLSLLAVLICSAQSELTVDVTEAGTLGSLLGDKKNQVTKLTVTGKINGDDVAVLRTITDAFLTDIDLKDAQIVAGGGPFYQDYDGVSWYTEDNKVPAHMFDQCYFNSIVLPETATEIGDQAFANCYDLKSVTFGSQLKKIGSSAFYYCQSLSEIMLPDYIEEIGDQAFANCAYVTSIHFPLNLKSIGKMSFMACYSLEEVTLPEGMISLGMASFFNCKQLKTVSLPASLSDIQDKAFSNCEGLAEIYEYAVNIPTFGENVFNNVDKNTCIVYVPMGMANDYSECPAFMDFANIEEFDTAKRDVIVTVTTPGTLKQLLGENALNTIESLTIKGKINNDDLKVLTIMTEGADYITGERAYALKYIDMQDADIVAGGENNLVDGQICEAADNTLTGYTFNYRTGLEKIILPKSLEVIGDGAFNGDENLTEIVMFDNVREIGGIAFYETSIKNINIPEGVEMIAMSTFSSCKYLESITLPSTLRIIEPMAFMNCKALQEIKIPEGITKFGTAVFFGCDSLKKVWLPSTLTDMGPKTFSSCYEITEVHIRATTPPAWNKRPFAQIYESAVLYVPEGCKDAYKNVLDDEGNGWGEFIYIEEEADETEDKPVEIKNPVFIDGIYYNLSEDDMSAVVTFGDASVEESRCTPEYEVESITIPSTVTYNKKQFTVKGIGQDAFRFVKELKNIVLPETLDSIGESAFKLCYGLEKVTFPKNMKKIGRHAFFSCGMLKEFNMPMSISEIEEGAFAYCYSITSFDFPENITVMNNDIFKGCESLTSIVMHEGLKSIGNYAFSECCKLEAVEIPNSVETLGIGAFESCWNLQEINIPENIKVIPEGAFLYCKSVQSIKIPNNVERIEKYAFSYCKAATEVTIGANVEYIGVNAFEMCPIENLRFEDSSVACVLESDMIIDYGEISAFEDIQLKNIYFGREVQNFVRWNNEFVEEITFGPGMNVWYDDYCGATATKIVAQMADPTQMVPNFDANVYENAQLVVPAGLVEAYAAAEGWKNFINIIDENGVTTGIDGINAEKAGREYYNAAGIRTNNIVKGLNIIKSENGKVKKIYVR